MARPKKEKTYEKSNRVTVRFTDEEMKEIQEKSDKLHLSVSEYIRERVNRGKINVHYATDPETDPRRKLAEEYHKIGINLNQIAKHLNSGGIASDQLLIDIEEYSKYKDLHISDKCCEKLKKEPLRRKAKELGLECAILGILASESYQREKEWLEYGCNVFHIRNDNQSKPLSFWTDEDIHEYISKYNVRIPKLYDMGYTRNGCMYCGFGVHLEPSDNNRYQRLKETHPIQYSYFIKNFGDMMLDFEINVA